MTESKQPLVSVVTPAYNQGKFLRDTIESVLSQDYPNVELYVINDGSTDDTEKILQEYNGRIKWETHANRGQTATINKGWKLTNGSVITWLNSDDTFLPGAVSEAVNYFNTHPETAIVFGDSVFTEEDGTHLDRTKPVPAFNYIEFVRKCENPIAQPSAFIKREVVQRVGELDPTFFYFMDWDFWLRAGLHFKIDHISALWSTYRLHAGSKTIAQSKKAAPELEYMYTKFFSRDDLTPEIKRVRKKAMMNMYLTTAGYYLVGEDQKSASAMAGKALRQHPLGIFSVRGLHKYLYARMGGTRFYKGLKKIFGRK